MAYDPNKYDLGLVRKVEAIFNEPADSMTLAQNTPQNAYRAMAGELNSLPVHQRTDTIRQKVELLARDAHEAAREANQELVLSGQDSEGIA